MSEYQTAKAFETALSTRLRGQAKEQGIDVNYLRRIVAMDAFLARLVHGNVSFFLKGGYAMELRMAINRTTKDVDISFASDRIKTLGPAEQQQELLLIFRDACARTSPDFFVFDIGEAKKTIEQVPYGGARFPVRVLLSDKLFAAFGLDVVIGDNELEPADKLMSNDYLSFANIPPVEYRAISAEQQFAEKLHAYTDQSWEENSRVKDLVDLVLLINQGKLERTRLKESIRLIFNRRKTHKLPEKLSRPPENWKGPYAQYAKQCEIQTDYLAASEQVKAFVEGLSEALHMVSAKDLQPAGAHYDAKVVYLKDTAGYEIIINKGYKDGVFEGQQFLVFAHGKNLKDPDTDEDLGVLEIPKGRGVITHVQEKVAHLRCTDKDEPRRKTRKPSKMPRSLSIYNPMLPEIEEEEVTFTTLPFNDVKVGDMVREIR